MRAFINAGGRARWDFLIFEHNQHQVEQAETFANEIGFEKFTKKKSGRFISSMTNKAKEEHQAVNRKGEETQTLTKPTEEKYTNRELAKTEQLVKQYGSMMDYYNKAKISCKVATKEEKNIFITAEGLLMPCCWTAGRMYKWWHKDYKVEQVWDFIDRAGGKEGINVINNRLEDVTHGGLLQDIVNSWSLNSIEEGKFGVCAQKCGTEFDPFTSQFE